MFYLKDTVSFFSSFCQEKNFEFTFQMLELFLEEIGDFSFDGFENHVVLYLSSKYQNKNIIKFICILNNDKYIKLIKDFKESIDVPKTEANRVLKFF